jgi:hypothetical protein
MKSMCWNDNVNYLRLRMQSQLSDSISNCLTYLEKANHLDDAIMDSNNSRHSNNIKNNYSEVE